MPERIRKMRRLARGRQGRFSPYTTASVKLFYEQGKFMEDYEDDFDGVTDLVQYYPTYNDLSTYQLRCYFAWRTRYRTGDIRIAPTSFLFLHAYELLCGIGVEPGEKGYAALVEFRDAYKGTSTAFDSYMTRWIHDYVVFHGLDASLLTSIGGTFSYASVDVLARAQRALLAGRNPAVWPQDEAPASQDLPSSEELLDALCKLSRYRADRSRFIRDHREDVAYVACGVFARMVAHCNKRRKVGFVEGLFGEPVRISYSMFPSAVFWSPNRHEDATFVASSSEQFECNRGFWWHVLPCRRMDTSKDLGAIMHAVDARMRKAMEDAHPLKERSLPKYQGKFVDDAIRELLERKQAEEEARIDIDRSALAQIRSAAVRTREALLTDEEREDAQPAAAPAQTVASEAEQPAIETSALEQDLEHESQSGPQGSQIPHADLLSALLGEASMPPMDSLAVTLAVDEINEAFLDVVGDVVVEFDGEEPVLIEDYADDVRVALAQA